MKLRAKYTVVYHCKSVVNTHCPNLCLVSTIPLPCRRSAVVKFRCSVKKLRKKIPFRYSRKQQKYTQRQRQRLTGTAKRQRKNDNGWWKPGIIRQP